MGSLRDRLGAILSKLAQWLGLKPSEQRRFDLMDRKLAVSRAKNRDRLECLKDTIRELESQALRKKGEYEHSRGDTQRIIGGEIERLFRELDRLRGQETILGANLDRISAARVKIQELVAGRDRGLEEDELDDMALELQGLFEELKVADRATAELEKVAYQPPQTRPVDREQRMAEVAGETETVGGLSAETERRLERLEADEA